MDSGIQNDRHEMVVTQKYPSGAQEFFCPTCGRRFVMQWPPAYKRIILDPGDEDALHTGGTAGITMSITDVSTQAEGNQAEDRTGDIDDPYLSLWSKYIDDNIEF